MAYLAAKLRKERIISRLDAWEMRNYAVKSKRHEMRKKIRRHLEKREKHIGQPRRRRVASPCSDQSKNGESM